MHHYPFHIGDYLIKTAHLSIEEDCAYRRLIDLYYESESPIPDETQTVSKRIRMVNHSDIVDSVLREFFTLEEDGLWHQKHCDEVIAAYKAKCTHNRNAGKLGGRPKKEEKTQTVSKRFPNDNRLITVSNPNQEPITNNQEPIKPKPSSATDVADLPGWLSSKSMDDFRKHRKAIKKPLTKYAENLLIAELEKLKAAGHDPVACLNDAILNGWQKPYPPKPHANGRKPSSENFATVDYGTGGAL